MTEMMLIGEAKFYWKDVENYLKMRGKLLITD